MRILQILPELKIGGVERGTVDLSRELIQRNHQAYVVSNGGNLVKELEQAGATHFLLPVHKKSLFTIFNCVPKLAKVLEEQRIDIVHARSRVPALIAFLACRRTGTDFITTAHGYYNRGFFSRVMGWSKIVIVSSGAVARHMQEDFGVPPERIRLIPRGVDLRNFQLIARPPLAQRNQPVHTIGVVGRLTPIKGHTFFLQALARVIRVIPRVKALIVGEGKQRYEEELRILTRRLSLDRYVEFLGGHNNMASIYARLDILVLPTVTQEAFGRVLIEAAACGIPLVATRVGGIVDIIQDGINGILVAPGNPDELSQALIKLIKDPRLAERISQEARKKVQDEYSLEKMAQKTIKVYEQVLTSLRILVIKISALGDVILAIPSLKALRQQFPHAEIFLLVASAYKAALKNCPYISRILELPLPKTGFRDIWRMANQLRRLNFNIIIDLQNNRGSHLLAYLSAGNKRYGYDNGKFSFLLNQRVKPAKAALSPLEHQARTLRLLGVNSVGNELELWPEEPDQAWADDFLKLHHKDKTMPLIGINLQASPKWNSKSWPIENVALLLDELQQSGMQAVITGKGPDGYLTEQLKKLTAAAFINAVGATGLMQLACLIKRCDVYVTCDSAPLHLAYAMQRPVVALFGPTDLRRHTLDYSSQIVLKKDIPCSPCYKRRCQHHACMKEISAKQVLEAIKTLLR